MDYKKSMSNESTSSFVCSICQRVLTNKSNLTKHVRCVHRRSNNTVEEMDISELKCPATLCAFITMYGSELKRHQQKCPIIHAESIWREQHAKEMQHEKARADLELSQYKLMVASLRAENEILTRELEKAQSSANRLAEQAVNRPTLVSNTHNTVKITNYLSDFETYKRQTDPDHVRLLVDTHFDERYFFDGQQGLARFIADYIIRSQDGKMIMVCTDTSRKRFRFVNADSQLEEDLRARILTKKLSVPVKEVCVKIFDRIMERLKQQKQVAQGAFEIDFLDKKMEYAAEKYINIREFDGEEGHDFLAELAALLRTPQIEEVD